jgi:hypothetical protein
MIELEAEAEDQHGEHDEDEADGDHLDPEHQFRRELDIAIGDQSGRAADDGEGEQRGRRPWKNCCDNTPA